MQWSVQIENRSVGSIQKYTSITPKTNFNLFSAFADKDENPQLPGSDWVYMFSEENGTTKVNIVIYNEPLSDWLR